MAFVFDVNNLNGALGGAEAIFDLKQHLVAQGWVIRASGGGTGSGLFGAASDVITTAALMNVNNAWFVIRQPAAASPRREFMFQRGSSQLLWRMSFVTAGAVYTGGAPDEDTPPTGTVDEAYLVGTGAPAFVTFFPTAATYRYHIGADNASPFAFYFFTVPNGGGNAQCPILFEPMFSFDSLDVDPAVYFFQDIGTPDPFFENRINGTSNGPQGWFTKDLGGELFVRMNGFAYHGNPAIPGNMGTNPYDGDTNHYPIGYGRCPVATQAGWKGFGTIMRWLGIPRSTMDTLSTSGIKDRVVCSEIVLPWPNITPLV